MTERNWWVNHTLDDIDFGEGYANVTVWREAESRFKSEWRLLLVQGQPPVIRGVDGSWFSTNEVAVEYLHRIEEAKDASFKKVGIREAREVYFAYCDHLEAEERLAASLQQGLSVGPK